MRGVGVLVLVGVLVAGCSSGGRPASSAAGSGSPAAGAAGPTSAGPSESPATSGSSGPAGAATASPPLSSTELPTIGPARPPKRPSDNFKPIIADGRIRVADGCTDLITNSNVVWTLLGAPIKGLKDGDQVEVTGQ